MAKRICKEDSLSLIRVCSVLISNISIRMKTYMLNNYVLWLFLNIFYKAFFPWHGILTNTSIHKDLVKIPQETTKNLNATASGSSLCKTKNIAADDILIFYFYLSKKKRLEVSRESFT